MDYEKAYKEALERAKELSKKEGLAKGTILHKEVLEYIFPELAESDDEKIRKEIIEYIKTGTYHKDWLSWLEKQVPACLSHDDEIMIMQLTEYFTTGKGLQNTNDTVVEWLADVKRKLEKQGEQKPEWSDEDKQMLLDIDACIVKLPIFFEKIEVNDKDVLTSDFIPKARNWLKSLRPQNRWKASEQQMKALCDSIPDDGYLSDREILLDSLYKDLKAL